MNNFIKPGDVVTFTAPSGGVTAGTPVLIGNLVVVPQETVAQTLAFEGVAEGVFTLPKATGETWAEGDLVYWDNSAAKFTKTTTSNRRAGCAVASAATNDTTGKVRLTGAPAPTGA